MINPNEIRTKAERKYKSYLQSIINNENIFPLVIIGNKKPSKSIPEFRREIEELNKFSKERKGYGYNIKYEVRKTKNLGTQSLPTSILFETKKDFERFLNVEKEVEQFKIDYIKIIKQFPELFDWVKTFPKKVIDNSAKWIDLMKVCTYFKLNARPNLYLRELPISVHTKFIETNSSILSELLDILIEPFSNKEQKRFEKRFNLKFSQPLIRFKILDSKISEDFFSGLNDISTTVSQFNQLSLPIERVMIVENKTNLYTIALTLPEYKKTMVIFGSGFKVENLKEANWLKFVEIIYWGDIDVQGFEILSQVRNYFAQTKSFLMDEKTFDEFFEKDKGVLSKSNVQLNLTSTELSIYQKIKENNWRLEQEKIPLEYVKLSMNSQR
tara:strand:- start:161 stop:1312 length:1152 start_codon:yes stop_codon:yes gene_type:complete